MRWMKTANLLGIASAFGFAIVAMTGVKENSPA
jgi:hypothetical protein